MSELSPGLSTQPISLPSISPEAYLKEQKIEREVIDELGPRIHDFYKDMPNDLKRNHILIPEESLALVSLLKWIDLHLPFSNEKRRYASNQLVRLSRSRSSDILERSPEVTIEDLQQEARLATIIGLRRYNPELSLKLMAVISIAITSNLQIFGSKILSGGFANSSSNKKAVIASDLNLIDCINAVSRSSYDHGWSDSFSVLVDHPQFNAKAPVSLDASNKEETELMGDIYKQIPYDIEDTTTIDDFNAVESMNANLDTIFKLPEFDSLGITARQKMHLRLHFEQGLSYPQIAVLHKPPITRQGVYGSIQAAIIKLRTIKPSLQLLR